MPTEISTIEAKRRDLVRKFANHCVQCLLHSETSIATTEVTGVDQEAASSSSDPLSGIAKGMHVLSSRIEDVVAGERVDGINLRYWLLDRDQVSSKLDFLDDQKQINALNRDIRNQVNNRLGSSQQARMSNDTIDAASALTTTLIGVHAARLDSNWTALDKVLSWCDEALPKGYKLESFTLLRAANYYTRYGKIRLAMTDDESTQPPDPGDLNDLLDTAQEELDGMSERDACLRRLKLFLVDAVSQLPPNHLKSGKDHAAWLNKLDDSDLHSRFKYSLSRARFAQEEIPEAMKLSIQALQEAPPSDLPFIELCRQQLLMLEQEAASREEIARELTNRVARDLGEHADQITNRMREATNEKVSDSQDKIREEVKDSQEAIRSEIKDALLRVVEILGVFLAVAGVAVTAVGGIAGGGSVWRALTIYGLGFLTIVLLFFILRLMVLGPLIDIRKMFRKTSDSGPSGPAPNAPDAT